MSRNISYNAPFFSIVMPVYNVEKYLRESIESVLNQTFNSFELIMVNDGSTDCSKEICEEYCNMDSRCKLINQDNKGLLLARRRGINVSKGKYLINVDSDDKCEFTLLQEVKEIIDLYDADMIIYDYYKFDEFGKKFFKEPLYEDKIKKLCKTDVICKFVNDVSLNMMWIKCTKLELVDTMVDYSRYGKLNMAEDQLQTAALIERVNNIYYFNRKLYMYRINENSITKTQGLSEIIDSLKAKKRVEDMLYNCNCEKKIYIQFYNAYIRTLNAYILKNFKQLKNKEEYIFFMNKIKEYELSQASTTNLLDLITYKLLHLKNYNISKLLNFVYVIRRKIKTIWKD